MTGPWCATQYRANLVDMHIADDREVYLSQFDAEAYAEALADARVGVAYLYASSCLGIAYWPTQVGHQHAGVGGRDILGERIAACRRRGMQVVVYYNWWSKWNYTHHPDWRVVNARGETTAEYLWTPGRYGVCCINSPHGDFAVAQIEELCTGYEFDGLWVDMLFWPFTVCYCGHCRRRYFQETGREIPRTIGWEDPAWVDFQRRREGWLVDLLRRINATVRTRRPGSTVGYQTAAWSSGWASGIGTEFFRQSDYLAGDFYGGAAEQSFLCKLLAGLSEQPLFEYMTSRTPDLTDHTTTKSGLQLAAQAFAALAHNGRVLFIDAIDPAGTLNPHVYREIGQVFRQVAPFEGLLTPDARMLADVGIYLNFVSLFDPADNGRKVQDAGGRPLPVVAGATNIARTLSQGHVAYGVATPRDLERLRRFDVVIMPELPMVDEQEAECWRRYVAEGGHICVTGGTSLLSPGGHRRGDFLIADLLGVTYIGQTVESVTYVAPVAGHEDLWAPFTATHPLQLAGRQTRVAAAPGAQVLATVTLPYTDPADPERCSAAISNPPGQPTTDPAAVLHPFGKGSVLYLAGPLDRAESMAHRMVLRRLLALLASGPELLQTTLPAAAEVVVFEQAEARRLLLNIVSFQAELPNIPVLGARLAVRLDGRRPVRLQQYPQGPELPFHVADGYAEFELPRLDTFLMLGLSYA